MTVVFKLVGIKDLFILQTFFLFSFFFFLFFKIVLNSDGRVAVCRELLIKYVKEGRSESMHPSNNEATIVIVIIIKKKKKSRLLYCCVTDRNSITALYNKQAY